MKSKKKKLNKFYLIVFLVLWGAWLAIVFYTSHGGYPYGFTSIILTFAFLLFCVVWILRLLWDWLEYALKKQFRRH